MKLTIVFDNTTTRNDLTPDWGFACVIEHNGRKILFDTGADGKILLDNMRALRIDPKSIQTVFISHNHFDHVGGLSAFLNENSEVTAYLPRSLRGVRKAKCIESIGEGPRKLEDDLFTTGELEDIEQSLVLPTSKGLIVVVGCSHPDMAKILEAAGQFGTVYGIIGGLHGFDRYELFDGLQLICPTHCTQHKAEIRQRFGARVVEGGVGRVIDS